LLPPLETRQAIWAASGIGLACGMGLYHPAVFTTIFTLLILVIFSKLDRFFGGRDN
jgi:putative Mg2+ transporter-C (MgtC) family protein